MYFYFARYKPPNVPLSSGTALEVLKSLIVCVLLIYGRDPQFPCRSLPTPKMGRADRNGMDQVYRSLI